MAKRRQISGKIVDDYMKRLLNGPFNINNTFATPRSILKANLPDIEKLTLVAIASYYFAAVRRVPTCEDLANEVGCSAERMDEALLAIAGYFESERHLAAKHLH